MLSFYVVLLGRRAVRVSLLTRSLGVSGFCIPRRRCVGWYRVLFLTDGFIRVGTWTVGLPFVLMPWLVMDIG